MPIGSGIAVVKGHAYRNDFLLVRETDAAGLDLAQLARAMCDRHAGIGADGLIVYSLGDEVTRMRVFNADGSPSEVSGNGVRCLAALVLREWAAGVGQGDLLLPRDDAERLELMVLQKLMFVSTANFKTPTPSFRYFPFWMALRLRAVIAELDAALKARGVRPRR